MSQSCPCLLEGSKNSFHFLMKNSACSTIIPCPAGLPHAQPSRQSTSRPAKTYPDAPAWVATAITHLKSPPAQTATAETGVSFPPEDELPVLEALQKALGMPVKAVQGTSAAPTGTRGLILRLAMDPKGASSWWLGMPCSAGWQCVKLSADSKQTTASA